MSDDLLRLKRCLIEDELTSLAQKTSDAMARLRAIQDMCRHTKTINVAMNRRVCLVCGKEHTDD